MIGWFKGELQVEIEYLVVEGGGFLQYENMKCLGYDNFYKNFFEGFLYYICVLYVNI